MSTVKKKSPCCSKGKDNFKLTYQRKNVYRKRPIEVALWNGTQVIKVFYIDHVSFSSSLIIKLLIYIIDNSEFMGKTFQATQLTNERFLTPANHFFDICQTELPWTSGLRYATYCTDYTPEVGESSVWQISKKYYAGVIYGQKALVC